MSRGDSAPPSAPNRLLALPRELRDIIYEYALTEDEGLLLFERRTLGEPYSSQRIFEGRRLTDPDVESNRLKYVCRQLYDETKGLGLGLNDLAMHSKRQIEGFAAFLHTCSASQQQWIRKVTLNDAFVGSHGYLGSWEKAIETLRPYGASHPCMKFHLYVGSLSTIESAAHWLLLAGIILHARYMHANHTTIPPQINRMAARITADRANPIPSHIRVFPGKGPGHVLHTGFDEESVQRYGEEQVKICTRELEKWQREGI
ncbi:hypothetical protein J4E80_006620 [Alternaria sp. BMP 0032]|nr:hypothetical protein J4E80_006620 [Alternaria sp. BMP 0032]